jgi:hypothetical protein
MKLLIVCILIFLNTLSVSAQGIYFDSLYHANETIHPSVLAQIFATDSGYVTVGLQGPLSHSRLELIHLDFDGTQLSSKNWAWPDPTGVIYWYGKAFKPLSDGGYLWSDDFTELGAGIIRFDENLDTIFTLVSPPTSNLSKRGYLFLEKESYYLGVTSIQIYDGGNYTSDLEVIKLSHEGNVISQDTVQIFNQEYQLSIKGIHPLSDGGFIISGARLFDWDPFIAKFDAEGDFVSEYNWGGQYNDWLPFLEPVGVDSFMVSYAETEEIYLNTYNISRPKMMLFNAHTMSQIWTQQADSTVVQYYNQSISRTSDNGFVTCGYHVVAPANYIGFIQKWSANGEEEWSRSYRHTPSTGDIIDDRQAFWDITEAPDSGLIACGYYYNGNSDPQHAWVLKLDGCGDPVFDSCVVVYNGVWTGKNIPALNNLFVWPNPFQNHLNIQLPEHSAIVDILDVMGTLVYSTKSYQLTAKLDLSHLPVGVYIIRARLESGEVLSKNVIKSE